MKILITGGAGFIGINLTIKLLQSGHKIILADNFITSEREKLKVLKNKKNWKFVETDISRQLPNSIRGEKFDQIYHLACPTGVPNLTRLAEEMLLTCSYGTRNILELARINKAAFLLTSSSEVYGDPKETPQSEEYSGNVDCTGIRSPYEEGKRFAESLTIAYFRKYHLNCRIVRIFNTYGPYMSSSDERVIPRFIVQAGSGKMLTVQDGRQKRTFCFVDDLINGLILAMNKGKACEVYNIGSDKAITIDKLAQLILKISESRSKIRYIKRPTHDHQERMPDLAKISKLGFKNTNTLREGLRKTLAHVNHRLS